MAVSFRLILVCLFFSVSLNALEREPIAHWTIGGGTIYHPRHSDWLLQLKYEGSLYFWNHLRPQAVFMRSGKGGTFAGLGIAWEQSLYDRFLIVASFTPGVYWNGRGKDLGSPIEFRSGLSVVYEMASSMRLGVEIFHVSNAHLSHRNPGFNAITLNFSTPL